MEEVRGLKTQLGEASKQLEKYIKDGVKVAPLWRIQGESLAQPPESTWSASKAERGGKVYITGGHNCDYVQVFDVAANSFTAMPSKMANVRNEHTSCLIGEAVYSFGGWIGGGLSDSVEVMDIFEGVWGLKKNLPSARRSLTSCLIGDRAFLFGGQLSDKNSIDEILVYNPTTDSYLSGGHMLDKRSNHISEELGGYILTAGGHNGNNLDSCEIFVAHAQKSVQMARLNYTDRFNGSAKLSE
eukprot:TRINITY_DN1998_c0_g1_i1.p1 TRINITY_DN1998_c0_g1~~TRINITY_DN1998_c0_g1_i1.p1  ORF type:complete len:249 (+),score=24.50 TRINITY_DN1998_c0_g1_i1:22-747(+)